MTNGVKVESVAQLGCPTIEIAQAVTAGDYLLLNGIGAFSAGSHAAYSGTYLAEGPEKNLWQTATRQPKLHPLQGSHKQSELTAGLDGIQALLNAKDSKSQPFRLLATEQHFDTSRTVPLLHRTRRKLFSTIPPSTSVLHKNLIAPAQVFQMDAIAAVDNQVEYLAGGVDIPATSGFVPLSRCRDLYWTAGFMAAHGEGDLGGVAPEVLIPKGHQWKGDRVRNEVKYIWTEKLMPLIRAQSLEAHHISKASVFYTEPDDLPEIVLAWEDIFLNNPPLTNYICVKDQGLAISEAQIEINLCLDKSRKEGANKIHKLEDGFSGYTRFGDFLIYIIFPDIAKDREKGILFYNSSEYESYNITKKLNRSLNNKNLDYSDIARMALYLSKRSGFLQSTRVLQNYFMNSPIPLTTYYSNCLPMNNIQGYTEVWVYSPKEESS